VIVLQWIAPVLLLVSLEFSVFSQAQKTLEDIYSSLNLPNGPSQPRSRKKKRIKIQTVRPVNLRGYKVRKGHSENLMGVEVIFKARFNGDELRIPICYCYFFGRKKSLLERKNMDFIQYGPNRRPIPFQAQLYVKNKSLNRILFSYPATFVFKYALVVIGDQTGVEVLTYPRSADPKDFDFEEKQLYLKNSD